MQRATEKRWHKIANPRFLIFETQKIPKALFLKASGSCGIKWARTIDLHDVNVAL